MTNITPSTDVPKIDPVPDGIHRPLWSVMIPTYNCAKYLRQTLESVLAQDPGPDQMQIEVVDDCSTKDDPEAVVKELGKGRVAFYRQPQNVGATRNFNTCIQRSRGHLVHILHGDDTILPDFYQAFKTGFNAEPSAGASFCRYVYMDEEGLWKNLSAIEKRTAGLLSNWIEKIAVEQRIQCPSIVVRRSVYESIGGFNSALAHTADWEMWRRISARCSVWYEPRTLACYRIHSASDSSRLMRTAANIEDTRRSIIIAQSYLPEKQAAELSQAALTHYALYALETARGFLLKRDFSAARAQVREALRCSRALIVLRRAVTLAVWFFFRGIRWTWNQLLNRQLNA